MTSALWKQTGGVWPIGVSCSLTWLDLGAIAHILQVAQIKSVVEIGVEHGGLAAYLEGLCYYTQGRYLGIDITLNALQVQVRADMCDLIEQHDAWSAATVERVGRWVGEGDGPALLICDGGDKPRELALYAPLLRPGDVLIGHDYGNEYGDDALAAMPTTATQVRADWLDDTLLCMFVRGGG